MSERDDFKATFDRALISFSHYNSVEEVPRAFFRSTLKIIKKSRMEIEFACDRIAQAIGNDQIGEDSIPEDIMSGIRDAVAEKMGVCRDSQPGPAPIQFRPARRAQ